MPWLVIFSIDYRPASHYSCWNALSSLRSSHSWIVFSSCTTKSVCTSYKPLCPLSMTVACSFHLLCVFAHVLRSMCMFDPVCYSHRLHINLNPAFSKLNFYSSVSLLTYLLPFHHLRQGYPEAGSTFMGTRGRGGGLGGGRPGFAASNALIDLV